MYDKNSQHNVRRQVPNKKKTNERTNKVNKSNFFKKWRCSSGARSGVSCGWHRYLGWLGWHKELQHHKAQLDDTTSVGLSTPPTLQSRFHTKRTGNQTSLATQCCWRCRRASSVLDVAASEYRVMSRSLRVVASHDGRCSVLAFPAQRYPPRVQTRGDVHSRTPKCIDLVIVSNVQCSHCSLCLR